MKDKVIDITQYKFDQAGSDLRAKLVEYSERPEIQSQLGEAFYIWKDDPDFIADDVIDERIGDITFEKFFDWFLHDFRLLDTGERVIERFYNEERETLTHPEESIIKGWLASLYSFFEIIEIAPGGYCDIRDLFFNKEYRIRDSSASKQLKTSDIIGARPLKAGTDTYFSGIVSAYPAAFKNIILDYFDREFDLYAKSLDEGGNKETFLRDLGYKISGYADYLANNLRLITPEGEELVLASATYKVKDRNKTLEKLEGIQLFKQISGTNEEIRVFSLENGGGNYIAGSLELDDNTLKIVSYSVEMLNTAKSTIERELRGFIEHLEDNIKGIESYADKTKKEAGKLHRLPPGVKSKKELDKKLDEYYAEWVDMPLAVLSGLTPREATVTTDGRKKLNLVLIELENIYKLARERGEPYYDIKKIRQELKLK